ncbi:hypothetical protein TIFTF001_046826 [Ficus carica]|uniref:Uncharacterized protein n=1 Tax=Ficus carica TaxID=3494 RepID=A0AA88CIP3_FICCA|nr:hypothetical protein TIFTF001_046826 [Ficus carica]
MLLAANPLDSTVVASKCANVVAGAGSVKSSVGTRRLLAYSIDVSRELSLSKYNIDIRST